MFENSYAFNFYGVRSQTQINHYGAKTTTNYFTKQG